MKLVRRIFIYWMLICTPVVIALSLYAVLAGATNSEVTEWVDTRWNGLFTWLNLGLPWSTTLEAVAVIAYAGIVFSLVALTILDSLWPTNE